MTHTILSSAGGPGSASVDDHGLVTVEGADWSLDWWVRAEDRWHRAGEEVAVRQRLGADGVAIETLMRVPGGDIVQTVHVSVAPRGAGPVAAVAVRNDSAVPVALALVVRGGGDGVDAPAALRLPGEPADTFREGDDLALVYPLAHTAWFRCAVALTPAGEALGDLSALPPADAVARGWDSHFAQATRVEVPDARLQAVFDAARRRVVGTAASGLASGGPGHRRLDERDFALVAAALAELGHPDDAALVLDAVGWREPPDVTDLLSDPFELAETASPTGAVAAAGRAGTEPDDLGAAAQLLLGVRALLLTDDSDGGLRFLSSLPAGWEGQPVEIHGAPTSAGLASIAVRWHGSRPALLWGVEGDGPFGMTAPGLDADWSTADRVGEALLGEFSGVDP